MYMIRHFGIQNMVLVQYKFRPCFEEPANIESWIRPPSSLLHPMNDSELFWRASFAPRIKGYPFERVPKIAFMFLTKGPLPMAPLWEKFFKGHHGLYSIYVHSHPSYTADFPSTSVFYRRQIPSQTMLNINTPHLLAWEPYVDWSRGGAHPATFGKDDIKEEFFKKILEDQT